MVVKHGVNPRAYKNFSNDPLLSHRALGRADADAFALAQQKRHHLRPAQRPEFDAAVGQMLLQEPAGESLISDDRRLGQAPLRHEPPA